MAADISGLSAGRSAVSAPEEVIAPDEEELRRRLRSLARALTEAEETTDSRVIEQELMAVTGLQMSDELKVRMHLAIGSLAQSRRARGSSSADLTITITSVDDIPPGTFHGDGILPCSSG
jgi:hypothetical protein